MERSPIPLYLLVYERTQPLERLRWWLVRESFRQEPSWVRRLGKLLFAAGWPVIAAGRAASTTYTNRTELRRVLKKSPWRILIDQWIVAVWYGLPLVAYLENARTLAQRPRAARQIVANQERAYIVNVLIERLAKNELEDKYLFSDRCQRAGLPSVPVLYRFRSGHIEKLAPTQALQAVYSEGLFAKPSANQQGIGAMAWAPAGGGMFQRAGHDVQTLLDILEEVRRRSLSGQVYLLQPRVRGHKDLVDLHTEALSTVRLLTVQSLSGATVPLSANFRMGSGTSPTDNFCTGGLSCPVDLSTGVLGPAIFQSTPLTIASAHPDTGATIEGRVLPDWHKALELASDAHKEFREFFLVGWDIAFTDNGPILIEGNEHPTMDIQFITGHPLGDTEFSQFAEEWLSTLRNRHRHDHQY